VNYEPAKAAAQSPEERNQVKQMLLAGKSLASDNPDTLKEALSLARKYWFPDAVKNMLMQSGFSKDEAGALTKNLPGPQKAGTTNFSPDLVQGSDDVTAGAASPNIEENLKFQDAKKRLSSSAQSAFRDTWEELDKSLGIEGSHHHAVGDWSDGAENSVLFLSHQKDLSQDAVRYSLAKMGLQADQKAVAHFASSPKGADAMYVFDLPGNTDLNDVRQVLDNAGVKFRTIVPHTSGLQVAVIDIGSKLAENTAIQAVADHYGIDIKFWRGDASFIEGRSRADARRVYRTIIREYDAKKRAPRRIGRPPNRSDIQSSGSTRDPEPAP
jgi:hypothetical protein